MSDTDESDTEPQQRIIQGDCMDVMAEMDAESVHAVVCDPPYNFEGGFMGQEWDNIGTLEEYREWCEAWASEALRVLKPGGHLIAFSGSRTHSHLFCGVHDAGFELRDTLTWHYSQGFPKGSDIGESIDANKYEREHDVQAFGDYIKERREEKGLSKAKIDRHLGLNTAYSWWEGRKSGIQLPDWEHYIQLKDLLGLDNRFDDLLAKEGADREIVSVREGEQPAKTRLYGGFEGQGDEDNKRDTVKTAPATDLAKKWDGWRSQLKNCTEFAVLAQKPLSENAIYKNVLEHETGALNISATEVNGEDKDRYPSNVIFHENATAPLAEQHTKAPRYFYTPKASKNERSINGQIENNHSTVKPLELMEWLVTLVTAPGQRVLDPFAGSGTTIMACRRLGREGIGIEMDDEHAELARKRVELAHELETERVPAIEPDADGQNQNDEPATLESFAESDD